jgi:hypothetical protein
MAAQSRCLDELYSLSLIQEAITSRLEEGAVLGLIIDASKENGVPGRGKPETPGDCELNRLRRITPPSP